jgi:hypothetical protein
MADIIEPIVRCYLDSLTTGTPFATRSVSQTGLTINTTFRLGGHDVTGKAGQSVVRSHDG